MRVTVADFFHGGFPRGNDLDLEGEIDARERMVAIEQHFVAFNARNRYDRVSLIRSSLKLITELQLAFHRQHAATHLLYLSGIAFSIGLPGRNLDADFRSGRGRTQLFIKSINNLTRPFKISDGLAAGRRIEHATTGITKGVIKSNNAWHGETTQRFDPAVAR